jgi:nanoRNase/pAp phosphatase (c-di-AMP/oligoRNAs hydrolase)
VDTQPGFGNNSLPADAQVLAVIDHHGGPPPRGVPHADVRPAYGAVCSILVEYVASAGVALTSRLATAVCYGIASETQDLGREATRADVAAFLAAFPDSNLPLLGRLRHPPREVSFFLQLDRVIRTTRVLDNVGICHLGAIPNPDVPAEMADTLVSVEGIDWAMCTGAYRKRLIVSLRTVLPGSNAGELLRGVIGRSERAGGHDMVAGGSVDFRNKDERQDVQVQLSRRLLAALGCDPDAERLLLMSLRDAPPAAPCLLAPGADPVLRAGQEPADVRPVQEDDDQPRHGGEDCNGIPGAVPIGRQEPDCNRQDDGRRHGRQ